MILNLVCGVLWVLLRFLCPFFFWIHKFTSMLYICILWHAKWIGHILRRNCLLQRVIEGKIQGEIEVTGRQGRRRAKLLDELKERRGYSHLKEEALDRTVWRARFGRGFGPVVRQTTKWMMIEWMNYDTVCGHMSVYERPYMFLQQVSATSCTANKSVCFNLLKPTD